MRGVGLRVPCLVHGAPLAQYTIHMPSRRGGSARWGGGGLGSLAWCTAVRLTARLVASLEEPLRASASPPAFTSMATRASVSSITREPPPRMDSLAGTPQGDCPMNHANAHNLCDPQDVRSRS